VPPHVCTWSQIPGHTWPPKTTFILHRPADVAMLVKDVEFTLENGNKTVGWNQLDIQSQPIKILEDEANKSGRMWRVTSWYFIMIACIRSVAESDSSSRVVHCTTLRAPRCSQLGRVGVNLLRRDGERLP
jgi:hypothetical protein